MQSAQESFECSLVFSICLTPCDELIMVVWMTFDRNPRRTTLFFKKKGLRSFEIDVHGY